MENLTSHNFEKSRSQDESSKINQKASFFVSCWDFLIHCVRLCLRPRFEALCVSPLVTRFFLTQICFYYSILLLAQTACMWLTILQLNCQSPVSCHEQQKFEAVLASEAKSKEGNEIQHSGLFNVARGSIVQRLWVWSEKNCNVNVKQHCAFLRSPGMRRTNRVASFSDFRKDCDTSTNYYRPEAYPV